MVTEAEKKIEELEAKLKNIPTNTATDMLKYIENENKRKDRLIITLIICWLLTIAGFIWYLTLPVEEEIIYNEDGNANYIGNDMNGDFYYGEDKNN